MALRLSDTRTGEVSPFTPQRDGQVGIYVCGATVQGAAPPWTSQVGGGLRPVVAVVGGRPRP
jgi:hypothetical protein